MRNALILLGVAIVLLLVAPWLLLLAAVAVFFWLLFTNFGAFRT
jgi:hypothetical protein